MEQCVCLQSDRPNTVYKPIDYGCNIATVVRSLPQVNASARCVVTVPTPTAAGKLRLFRNSSPSPISAPEYLIPYCETNGLAMDYLTREHRSQAQRLLNDIRITLREIKTQLKSVMTKVHNLARQSLTWGRVCYVELGYRLHLIIHDRIRLAN